VTEFICLFIRLFALFFSVLLFVDFQCLFVQILDTKTTSSLAMFYPPLLSYEGDTHSPALLSPPRSVSVGKKIKTKQTAKPINNYSLNKSK
jgi:hypothetical protein